MSGVGSSVLFQPYRSLGLISSHARPHLKSLGTERFLTAALGKSWQVYNLDKLRVALIGPAREHTIRAITSFRDLTFTTCGREIIVWRRQEEVYRITEHQSAVYLLYLFGSTLVSVDESQLMCVWDVKALTPATSVKAQVARTLGDTEGHFTSQKGERLGTSWRATPMSTIQFPQTSRISTILHPSTYLNKIVVGFGGGAASHQAGGLELWNIHTRTMIYRFKTDAWSADQHNPDRMLDATLGRNQSDAAKNAARENISVTCLENSPAIDVVAVGLHSGLILLLNLKTDTLLHVYVHASITAGSGALGEAQARGSPICALSFRTDANQPHLASTSLNNNTVCIWDLEKKQLKTMIKAAHGGGIGMDDGTSARGSLGAVVDTSATTIHTLYFLPGEPLLITVGTDNALKQWIFDAPDGTARLLKERSGHSAPPNRLKFYPGERGILDLMSAGPDRSLRSFSLQKEEQSRELSQSQVEKRSKAFNSSGISQAKLTPVIDMAYCATREKEWPNILTAHQNDCAGYTWKWSSKALSQHKLLNTQPGVLASAVKSVCVSACGNFGFLGYTNGRIDSFYMQSGSFKATYGANHLTNATGSTKDTSLQTKDLQAKNINLKRKAAKAAASAASAAPAIPLNQGHTAAITGLASDSVNKQVVSASLDGSVIFWEFSRRNVLGRLDLGSPIQKMTYSYENDFVACMTDALVLYVIDAATRVVIRKFSAAYHSSPLTDLIFAPHGKWLLTSSSDCCLRIFDLPSSTLIDYMRFSKPITSMSLSPKSEFLATTHVGNLGIFLWANKEFFGTTAVLASAGIHEGWKARRVHNHQPLLMEVKERQDAAEDDEVMTDAQVKQEGAPAEEEEEDEENESDEEESVVDGEANGESKKRRRLSRDTFVTTAHTPLLHLPEDEQFGLITYSAVPKSRWQTLAHLDEIKARNKVKEALAPAKPAPFFLTALTSLSNEKDGASLREKEQLAAQFGVDTAAPAKPTLGSRTVKSGGHSDESHLLTLIKQAKETLQRLTREEPGQNAKILVIRAFADVCTFLQALTPAAIDGELHMLGLLPTAEESEFRLVLEFCLACLETGKNFEFTQAFLNRFLKIHGTTLLQYPALLRLCAVLKEVQARAWSRLEEAFHANLALVSHLAQIQL